jgi:hypothetical protein
VAATNSPIGLAKAWDVAEGLMIAFSLPKLPVSDDLHEQSAHRVHTLKLPLFVHWESTGGEPLEALCSLIYD